MARKVPDGANRGPRDKKVTIYLSEEEIQELDRVSDRFGFRSKGALIAYILEIPLSKGFSGLSFWRVGNRMADLIDKMGAEGYDWSIFNFFNPFKKRETLIDPSEFYIEGEEDEFTDEPKS